MDRGWVAASLIAPTLLSGERNLPLRGAVSSQRSCLRGFGAIRGGSAPLLRMLFRLWAFGGWCGP